MNINVVKYIKKKLESLDDRVMKKDINLIVFNIKKHYEDENYTPIKNYDFIFFLDSYYLDYFFNCFSFKETDIFIEKINNCIKTSDKLHNIHKNKNNDSVFSKQSKKHKKMLSMIINKKIKESF